MFRLNLKFFLTLTQSQLVCSVVFTQQVNTYNQCFNLCSPSFWKHGSVSMHNTNVHNLHVHKMTHRIGWGWWKSNKKTKRITALQNKFNELVMNPKMLLLLFIFEYVASVKKIRCEYTTKLQWKSFYFCVNFIFW